MSRPHADSDPFQAIAHSARRRMLDLLRRKPHTVGELLDHFRMSGPTLSHHLGVLRNAELVTQKRAGRYRVYEVDAKRLRAVSNWVRQYQPAK